MVAQSLISIKSLVRFPLKLTSFLDNIEECHETFSKKLDFIFFF